MLHPDVRVFARVTGGRIPGLSQYRTVIEVVRFLRGRERMDDQALAVYLAPYWLAWSSRKRLDGRPYDPGNVTWLTEWALNGSVRSGKEPAEEKGKAEVIKEVAGRKKWQRLMICCLRNSWECWRSCGRRRGSHWRRTGCRCTGSRWGGGVSARGCKRGC